MGCVDLIGTKVGAELGACVGAGLDHGVPAPIALGALERWLSTQGVTAPSNKVSAWLGSLNGIVASQATGANQMDYVANSANLGGPAIVSRDASDFIEAAFAGGELDNGLTLFVFGYVPAAMSAAWVAGSRDPATGNNGRSALAWQVATNTSNFYFVATDAGVTAAQNLTNQFFGGQKAWFLCSYAPEVTARSRTHTVTVENSMAAGAVTPTRFFMGSTFGNAPVDFEYSEVVLFNRQLSIADENAMAAYGESLRL